jgi:hypothetical protein
MTAGQRKIGALLSTFLRSVDLVIDGQEAEVSGGRTRFSTAEDSGAVLKQPGRCGHGAEVDRALRVQPLHVIQAASRFVPQA